MKPGRVLSLHFSVCRGRGQEARLEARQRPNPALTLTLKYPDGVLNAPPDGLVKGCTQDLVVVLGEAQAGHSFVVGVLKPAQAQPALYRPHLTEDTRGLHHEASHATRTQHTPHTATVE